MIFLGSALFRNVAKMRRQLRVRHPIQELITHHNMNTILKDEFGIKKKARCIRFKYEDKNEWNWFIHHSITTTDRGKLFNLQMCRYLTKILNNDAEISAIFQIKYYQTGLNLFLRGKI